MTGTVESVTVPRDTANSPELPLANDHEALMHEMGLVQSIMEILEQQAELHRAKRVTRVSLEFGALTGVMPAAIEFAFEVLSKGSIADGAQLDITIIPMKARCFDCGKETALEVYQPFCPACSSGALKIIQGRDEMRIASLEIEDSDEPALQPGG